MKASVRKLLLRPLALLVVAYAGAVGFLALREDAMVFVGAGRAGSPRSVPGEGTGVPWDSLRVPADDGVPVFLLVSRLDDGDAAPWALFFHGNGGLVGDPGGVERYRLLREAGFNVLAVEFRGYGASASAGEPSEAGLYADARAAWSYLTASMGVAPERVVAYGWSLGSGLATYLAVAYRPGGLVTEGAFTSLPDVAAALYPWMPARAVMHNRFENLSRTDGLALPWLVFHGRADAEVPFAHGEALAASAPGARLVPLDAGHDDGVTGDRDVALAALRDLARQVLGEHR